MVKVSVCRIEVPSECLIFYERCSAIEQKMNIPEGILKKEVKSKEQKTKDIEEVRSQWKYRSTLWKHV